MAKTEADVPPDSRSAAQRPSDADSGSAGRASTSADPSLDRLLSFARKLQRAASFRELLDLARDEAEASCGYAQAWFMVADREGSKELRLIEFSGDQRDLVFGVAPVVHVAGDHFLEDVVSSHTPVVVEDARSDPRTNKRYVEQLQSRTLIEIPLCLVDKPFAVFGVGTFGDEGCRPPTEAQLQYLVGMAGQIAVAASRIFFTESKARAEMERQQLERRLAQVQKLESLGMLAGGIAHDFNNLLTVIRSSAALAERQTADPALRSEIQAIVDAATRASDVTRQLLAMSRSQDLTLKPLDLNLQLSQILRLTRRLFPENITIEFIQGRGLPLVEGDPSTLDQVFMNLFINARDAMPDGGRLTIETEQVVVNGGYAETHHWAKPGRYVLVTVTDTGVGMPREVLDRVFEPFFTTKGPRAGTGLGLAVAYGVVRQHQGMLHCYSEVGVGTSFKVYLRAMESAASEVGWMLQRSVTRGEESILIAEDDDLVRAVAVRILERGGYRVRAVEHGAAACRAVASEPFDLVLLDVVMPGMPCREVIERIRALSPATRILLASGYTAGGGLSELARRTGLDALEKPFDPDEVLRRVRGALDAPPEPAPGHPS